MNSNRKFPDRDSGFGSAFNTDLTCNRLNLISQSVSWIAKASLHWSRLNDLKFAHDRGLHNPSNQDGRLNGDLFTTGRRFDSCRGRQNCLSCKCGNAVPTAYNWQL